LSLIRGPSKWPRNCEKEGKKKKLLGNHEKRVVLYRGKEEKRKENDVSRWRCVGGIEKD